MFKKFKVPILTMLASVIVWLVFIIFHSRIRNPKAAIGCCLLSVVLMIVSAVTCKLLNGPRIGSIVRAGVLVVMALITVWVVDLFTARIFLAAAVVPGVLASFVSKK